MITLWIRESDNGQKHQPLSDVQHSLLNLDIVHQSKNNPISNLCYFVLLLHDNSIGYNDLSLKGEIYEINPHIINFENDQVQLFRLEGIR